MIIPVPPTLALPQLIPYFSDSLSVTQPPNGQKMVMAMNGAEAKKAP